MLQIMSLVSLESSRREGCMGLVPWCLDLWCKISWILNDFFTKNKLNRSWKFQRNWNVPFVLLERSWWTGFNGNYLVRFGFRMWEILILKRFLLRKIQINSKKPGFGRKNQLRTWAGPTAPATLVSVETRWLMTTTSSGMGKTRYNVNEDQSPMWKFSVPSYH